MIKKKYIYIFGGIFDKKKKQIRGIFLMSQLDYRKPKIIHEFVLISDYKGHIIYVNLFKIN
jgi:hypothetical protein